MEAIGWVKSAAWGKRGSTSLAAQLGALNSSDFQINPEHNYSELWMGTHKLGPLVLKATGEPLPQMLPFLFKLVSIGNSGAIQVHPGKEDAARLHHQRPHAYPDGNYRPKIIIAQMPMIVMCGFRPYTEIYRFLVEIPPLRQLLVKSAESVELMEAGDEQGVKDCYERLFTSDKECIVECVDDISENYWKDLCRYGMLELFNELKRQYPYDVGLMSLFFLNILTLDPGEAVFVKPREIHCVVSGDFIACMTNSDNVIRAGLTSEFKDYGTLIACADFEGQPKDTKYFRPRHVDDYVRLFEPLEEFSVAEVRLPHAADVYTLQILTHGAILLTLSGERTIRVPGFDDLPLKRGSIVYLPPNAGAELLFFKVQVQANTSVAHDDEEDDESSSEDEDFLAYVAMTNVSSVDEEGAADASKDQDGPTVNEEGAADASQEVVSSSQDGPTVNEEGAADASQDVVDSTQHSPTVNEEGAADASKEVVDSSQDGPTVNEDGAANAEVAGSSQDSPTVNEEETPDATSKD